MSISDFYKRFFRFYKVKGIDGKKHFMNARGLYKRVLNDSKKSDIDWVASTSELLKICKIKNFPEDYAKTIEICILKCFTKLEKKKKHNGYTSSEDKKALKDLYNSLIESKDETFSSVRKEYFSAILYGITKHKYSHLSAFESVFSAHYGPEYTHICNKWIEAMTEKYLNEPIEDLQEFKRTLRDDFDKTIKDAEKRGAFSGEQDDHFRIVNGTEEKGKKTDKQFYPNDRI